MDLNQAPELRQELEAVLGLLLRIREVSREIPTEEELAAVRSELVAIDHLAGEVIRKRAELPAAGDLA
jgi:hypothetical protein